MGRKKRHLKIMLMILPFCGIPRTI